MAEINPLPIGHWRVLPGTQSRLYDVVCDTERSTVRCFRTPYKAYAKFLADRLNELEEIARKRAS